MLNPFSREGEGSLNVTGSSTASADPLDDPNFDPIDYINKKFPNEQSLSKIDHFIGELQEEVKSLDQQILVAVRKQATSSADTQRDLADVQTAIQELFDRIMRMKKKAAESENLVQEICRDIKCLDYGKKNLTTTITALKRLVMLVTALDQLRDAAANRHYRETANLILAIEELSLHFKDLIGVPKIAELLSQKATIFRELQKQLMEDFDTLLDTSQETCPCLPEAAAAVDAMTPDVRRDIVTSFCLRILEPYKKLFQPPEEASTLEMVERRYSWLNRTLREYDDKYASVFPETWAVSCALCEHFCHITRQHLVEVLGACHHTVDPTVLVRVLHKSIEVEEKLAKKFQNTTTDTGLNPFSPSAAGSESQMPPSLQYPDLLADAAKKRADGSVSRTVPRFKGIISECFEAYLGSWVRYEETQLIDSVSRATANDSIIGESDPSMASIRRGASFDRHDGDEEESDMPKYIFSSASEIFSAFKACLRRTTAISTHQTLFDIFQVFKRVLKRYADILTGRITKKVAPLTDEAARTIGSVIGTAEYCDSTLPALSSAIVRTIDEAFTSKVNFDPERDIMWNLKTGAVQSLVTSFETQLEPSFAKMTKTNWVALQEVGDQSSYVTEVGEVMTTQFPLVRANLSLTYYRFFGDKFAQWVVPKFISSIYACKKIGELGAQQLLLDSYSLKTLLLEVPVLAAEGKPVPAGYAKYVIREIGRAETLLKILSSSVEDVESLKTLLEGQGAVATQEEITRILSLKAGAADAAQAAAATDTGSATHPQPRVGAALQSFTVGGLTSGASHMLTQIQPHISQMPLQVPSFNFGGLHAGGSGSAGASAAPSPSVTSSVGILNTTTGASGSTVGERVGQPPSISTTASPPTAALSAGLPGSPQWPRNEAASSSDSEAPQQPQRPAMGRLFGDFQSLGQRLGGQATQDVKKLIGKFTDRDRGAGRPP